MARLANLENYNTETGIKRLNIWLYEQDLKHARRLRRKIAEEQDKPEEQVSISDVLRRALRTGK